MKEIYYRDIGNGKVRREDTGEILDVRHIRPDPIAARRTITFTEREWENLVELGKLRNKTPEECVRDFARNVPPKDHWQHPSKTT